MSDPHTNSKMLTSITQPICYHLTYEHHPVCCYCAFRCCLCCLLNSSGFTDHIHKKCPIKVIHSQAWLDVGWISSWSVCPDNCVVWFQHWIEMCVEMEMLVASCLEEVPCYLKNSVTKAVQEYLVFHYYTLSKPGCYTSTKNSSINIIPYIYCSLDNFIIILLIILFWFWFIL